MNERYQPDWDENQLSLGRPAVMDTPTFIEWVQRELELPEETQARHEAMREMHRLWHEQNPGIFACCIKMPRLLCAAESLTPNEMRHIQHKIQHSFIQGSSVVVAPEGMTITQIPER